MANEAIEGVKITELASNATLTGSENFVYATSTETGRVNANTIANFVIGKQPIIPTSKLETDVANGVAKLDSNASIPNNLLKLPWSKETMLNIESYSLDEVLFQKLWEDAFANYPNRICYAHYVGSDNYQGEKKLIADGLVLSNSTSRFACNGLLMNIDDAKIVYASRWTPGMTGVLPSLKAKTNLPQNHSSFTGNLDLSLCAASCYNLQVLALTDGSDYVSTNPYKMGSTYTVEDRTKVQPISIQRAFDGCSGLLKIIGVIDCNQCNTSSTLANAFRNCTSLKWVFLLDIPTTIEEIDLSWSQVLSPETIDYLYRFGLRNWTGSKKLIVRLHPWVYSHIAGAAENTGEWSEASQYFNEWLTKITFAAKNNS